MNELMQRRMALMMAGNKILFEWDHTEGLAKLNSVGSVAPVLASDGVLLQGGSANYSACAIAPNIPTIANSYRAEITYKDAEPGGLFGYVGFFHYNADQKTANIQNVLRQNGVEGRIQLVDRSNVPAFTLDSTGVLVIEFDAKTNVITFSQGQNSKSVQMSGVSTWGQAPRIIAAAKGESSGNSRVTLQHIKIERL